MSKRICPAETSEQTDYDPVLFLPPLPLLASFPTWTSHNFSRCRLIPHLFPSRRSPLQQALKTRAVQGDRKGQSLLDSPQTLVLYANLTGMDANFPVLKFTYKVECFSQEQNFHLCP